MRDFLIPILIIILALTNLGLSIRLTDAEEKIKALMCDGVKSRLNKKGGE